MTKVEATVNCPVCNILIKIEFPINLNIWGIPQTLSINWEEHKKTVSHIEKIEEFKSRKKD